MSFTLYNASQSACSQRVRFVLNAKKLSFAEVKLDLLAGDQLKPEYLALNPNGVVPTLEHDGAIVIDSSVIIEYLDKIAPALASFTPSDPVVRAKMRALIRLSARPHKSRRKSNLAQPQPVREFLVAGMFPIRVCKPRALPRRRRRDPP
jgi:glutathione S-transferase